MRTRQLLLDGCILALAFSLSTNARAASDTSMLFDGGLPAIIYSVDDIYLTVSDQVKDGCMPIPDNVKRTAEVTLRRNDFSITDEESLGPMLVVNVLGYETSSSSCAVYFQVILRIFRAVRVPYTNELDSSLQQTIVPITWEVYGTLLTGPKSSMQNNIEEVVSEAMDEFFIQIDRARDSVQQNWPEIWRARFTE